MANGTASDSSFRLSLVNNKFTLFSVVQGRFLAYNISKLQTLKANKNAPNLLKKYFKHFDNILSKLSKLQRPEKMKIKEFRVTLPMTVDEYQVKLQIQITKYNDGRGYKYKCKCVQIKIECVSQPQLYSVAEIFS